MTEGEALSTTPGDERAERYRHKARGTEYDLIGIAELQDASGAGVEEGALLAVYRGDDGKLWARRHKEFGDGRFERVAALSEHPPSSVMKELVEALTDDEAAATRIVNAAFVEAGCRPPFFGEAYEAGVVVKSIIEQVSALSRVQLPSVLMETFASIIQWGDETFGPAEPDRIIARAWEEWKEMLEPGADVPTEAADVIMVLLRIPGIAEAIQRKMAVNRGRVWRLLGDGTGYHVPGGNADAPQPTPRASMENET